MKDFLETLLLIMFVLSMPFILTGVVLIGGESPLHPGVGEA